MKAPLFLFAILIISPAFSQTTTPPAPGTPKDFNLPAKTTAQLPNGLRSVLVPYGAIPKVNIQLTVKTGNVNEAADEVWLGDLTGNLMKEGTKTMDFKTISKKVAAMGGEVNINVGMDQTTISGSVLSEFAPELMGVLADILINPVFPASELDRLKSDLKRELTVQKAVPQSQAREKFLQITYKDHPYGRYFPTEAMIDSYTLDKAKAFYEKNFGAKRTVVYVVGKFDDKKVTASIQKAFGAWREGADVDYPPVKSSASSEISIIDRKEAPQTTIMLGIPVITPQNSDFVALEVTNSLLGGSFGSRITTNIREDKGYTYSPFSTIQNRKGVSLWYEQADVTSEFTGASLQEISKEIKRLQSEPPSKEELEGIQKYEAGIFVLRNSTPAGIIGQLNFIDMQGLDDSYLTNKVKTIYSLTPEKISKMASEHLKYENMTLVMVGDKKQLEKQMKDYQSKMKTK